jgi:hypothetical protein
MGGNDVVVIATEGTRSIGEPEGRGSEALGKLLVVERIKNKKYLAWKMRT